MHNAEPVPGGGEGARATEVDGVKYDGESEDGEVVGGKEGTRGTLARGCAAAGVCAGDGAKSPGGGVKLRGALTVGTRNKQAQSKTYVKEKRSG
jgi:hypothetical protein